MPAVKPSFPTLRQSHPLAQGLVGCWPFYEGGGLVANDLSGQGHNGTLTGGVSWSAGQSGYALSLDGSTGKLPVGSGLCSYPFTVAVWGKAAATSHYQPFASHNSDWFFGFTSGNQAGFRDQNSGNFYLTSGAVADTNWHLHVLACASSAANQTIYYLDAAPLVTGTLSVSRTSQALNFGWDSTLSNFVQGLIDSGYCWNRVLSQAEIAQLYEDSYRMVRRSRTVLKTSVATISAYLRNLVVRTQPHPSLFE